MLALGYVHRVCVCGVIVGEAEIASGENNTLTQIESKLLTQSLFLVTGLERKELLIEASEEC